VQRIVLRLLVSAAARQEGVHRNREAVDAWRLDTGTVIPYISPAHVVGDDEGNVWVRKFCDCGY